MCSVVLLACGGDGSGPESGLERALARARPAATEVPVETAGAAGGTRTTATLVLGYGDPGASGRHELTVTRVIERGSGGAFRVRDERRYLAPSAANPEVAVSEIDAVEWVFDGAALAWRHGNGPWIERDVLDGLWRRALTEADGLAAFALAAVEDYTRTTPLGDSAHPTVLAGIPVRWSALTLDRSIRPVPLDDDTLAALRDRDATVPRWLVATHPPSRLRGEVARDGEGAVVALTLSVAGTTRFPGGAEPFTLEVTQTVEELGADASFALPAERLPESRERPWRMIEDVLGDALLPPYRK